MCVEFCCEGLPVALDEARVLELVRLPGRPPFESVSGGEARVLFLRGREILLRALLDPD